MTGVQPRITAYWSDRARTYEAYQQTQAARGGYDDAWSRVWTSALPTPPADVLDVGTGTGHAARRIAALGHHVTGIDLAEGMLAVARGQAAGRPDAPRYLVGDAVTPPFDAGSFDAVTSRYLMWTLREPQAALHSWRRLLRPGGVLALVDAAWHADGVAASPVAEFREAYQADVVQQLPLAEAAGMENLLTLVQSAGFTDVAATPLHELHDLDRAGGVPDPADVRLQHLVTARRP